VFWGEGVGGVRPRPAAGLGVVGGGGRAKAALGAAAHLGRVATSVAAAARVWTKVGVGAAGGVGVCVGRGGATLCF